MVIKRNTHLHLVLVGAVFLLAAMGFAAAHSNAAIYCVAMTDPSCTVSNQPNLQPALDAAAGSSGSDTVLVGPGMQSATNGFSYNQTDPGNTVEVIGSGTGQTTVTLTNTAGNSMAFQFFAAEGSSVSDLSVQIPDNNDDTNGDLGLWLATGNTASGIKAYGTDVSNATGIRCSGCFVEDSTVDVPDGTASNFGVDGYAGDTTVTNSTIRSDYGVRQSDPAGTASIDRSRVTASQWGAVTDSGGFAISHSLIELAAGNGATAVGLANYNNGTASPHATLDGVTIVGDGTSSNTKGILAYASSFLNPQSATLDIRNSVITGVDQPANLTTSDGGTVTADFEFSAYDKSEVVQNPGTDTINLTEGTGNIDLTIAPGFATPAGPDYVPLSTSPLVDAGDPADPAPGTTDILGNARACHGTSAGIIRRDIGAFEFKTDPADDCTYAVASIFGPESTTDRRPWFTLTSSKPNSTYQCSIFAGVWAACGGPSFKPPVDLNIGTHTLKVKAVDAFGNTQIVPTEKTFTIEAATCSNTPSLCPSDPTCKTDPKLCPPVEDNTAPKVTMLKAPKATKKKRVKVRFKSDEANVIFTCKLNKRPAKRCKSPWKTPKLKKGKNIVRVWVTDQAGNRSGIKKRTIRRR